MIIVPRGTAICMPSIVTVTRSSAIQLTDARGWYSDGYKRRLLRLRDVGFELRAELLNPAHHRRGAGVAQNANCLARHVLREIEEKIEILGLSHPCQNPLEDLRGPRRSLTALGALSAGLVSVEFGQPPDLVHHVGRVVHNDHPARPEHGALGLDVLVIGGTVLHLGGAHDGNRRASRD